MLANPSFRQGLRDSSLILLAVGSFAAGFGVLAVGAGFPVWLAILSSFVILSGAAQFTMLGLLAAGPAAVFVAVAGLGLRHVPMAAKLAQIIGPQPLLTRVRLAYVLVDETFGLTLRAASTGKVDDIVAYKTAADICLLTGWALGTGVGAVLGEAIDPGVLGIGVLFGLMFLGLAAPMVSSRKDVVVVVVAIVASVVAVLTLPEAWQITSAAMAAATVGVLLGE